MDKYLSSTPKCAVLLAAYNGVNYLEEQVISILQQQHVKVQLFISVDLSTDGTNNWFKELVKEDSRITLLPYGEQFGGASKNFFRLVKDVDLSHFDYIAFADQDDQWNADKLIRAVDTLKQGNYSGYSSNVIAFWPDGKQALIIKSYPQKKYDFIFEGAGPGCTYVINNQLMNEIKKIVLDNWNLLQDIWIHDWFFYAIARSRGYKWFIDPIPSMYYRQHMHNQIGANKGLKAYINRFKYLCNGLWFKQVQLTIKILKIKEPKLIAQWGEHSFLDLVRLSFQAHQCRRQKIHQVFFFCLCWFMIFWTVDD